MIVATVLVAAGSGSRLGSALPKAFVEIAGVPLLAHAVTPFSAHPRVRDLIVVAPAALVESTAALVPSARVVPGGTTRQESVARGLGALAPDVELVLVHDAARAFVPVAVIDRVIGAVCDGADAVIPVLAVVDTIKEVDADGWVLGTPDRARLRTVQTPQGFRRTVLDEAHAQPITDAPDDAALAEALGRAVRTVEGAEAAFKITYPADLERAESLVRMR
jgi:2-C-methyl-D-erythritol 4-phosphate cytidylyltransferase